MKSLKIFVLSSIVLFASMSASFARSYFVCDTSHCDHGVEFIYLRDALYYAERHHRQWIEIYVPQHDRYVRVRRGQLRNVIAGAERRNHARSYRYSHRHYHQHNKKNRAEEQLKRSLFKLFDKAINEVLR